MQKAIKGEIVNILLPYFFKRGYLIRSLYLSIDFPVFRWMTVLQVGSKVCGLGVLGCGDNTGWEYGVTVTIASRAACET